MKTFRVRIVNVKPKTSTHTRPEDRPDWQRAS